MNQSGNEEISLISIELFLIPLKFLLPIITFLVWTADTAAQDVLRKDGTSLPGKPTIKYRAPDSVFVEVGDQLIPASEVYGYSKKSKDKFLYLIPISDPDARKVEWDFRERSLEGEISLYGWTRDEEGIERKIIMAQRGEEFGFLYSSYIDKQSDNEFAERLKAWAGDVPSLAGALDSATMHRSFEGIVQFVKRYNEKKHTTKPVTGASATAIFFARPTLKLYSFTIVIEGGAQYTMTMRSPAQISLPHDQLVKACVNMGDSKDCVLIRGTACCRQYILVTFDPKKDGLRTSLSNEDLATRYINQERAR